MSMLEIAIVVLFPLLTGAVYGYVNGWFVAKDSYLESREKWKKWCCEENVKRKTLENANAGQMEEK